MRSTAHQSGEESGMLKFSSWKTSLRHHRFFSSGNIPLVTLRRRSQAPAGAVLDERVTVVEAVEYDVQVVASSQWTIGDSVQVSLHATSPLVHLSIPGIVHWIESRTTETQLGIVLEECIPSGIVSPQEERVRTAIRYPTHIEGALVTEESRIPSSSATIVNYSRDGICLQSATRLDVDSQVLFSWLVGNETVTISGVVRWSIAQGYGFLAGCTLTNCHGYLACGAAAFRGSQPA